MRMPNPETAVAHPEPAPVPDRWQSPGYEVVCLACEISSYAPDGDLPLF